MLRTWRSIGGKTIRLCAQCHGEEGTPPTLYRGADYPPEGVWLHSECVRFWLQEWHLAR